MAIDTNIHNQYEIRVGITEESIFGTEVTTDASVQELLITAPIYQPQDGLQRQTVKRHDGYNVPDNEDYFVSTHGGVYTVTVPFIATDTTIDYLLYGVMQDLTSEGADPFPKQFEWDTGTSSPDFSSNAGKFYTLCCHDPQQGWYLKSCILSSLTLNWSSSEADNRLRGEATFFSGFPPADNTFSPGDWTTYGTDFYTFLNTATVDGNDVLVSSVSMSFENNAQRLGRDSSGDAWNYHIGSDKDLIARVEPEVKYDANTCEEIDSVIANPEDGTSAAEVPIVIQWGDGSADGTAKFEYNAIYDGELTTAPGEANGMMITLPCLGVSDGTNEAVDVTVVNAIERSW